MISSSTRRGACPPLARAALLALLALGCNQQPSDLRVWRASDHDHDEGPRNDQVQVDPTAAGPAVPGLEDVTIVAWQQNCTQCHGQLGRGDGPRGPMLKATDLSEPRWQAARTDEQIASVIKLGKGAMPSFSQLPDATIAKLVKLVRMMNLDRSEAHAGAAPSSSAGAAPAPRASGVSVAPKAAPSPKSSGG